VTLCIKQSKHIYRVHNYLNVRNILALKQKKLDLERHMYHAKSYANRSADRQTTSDLRRFYNTIPKHTIRKNRFKFYPTYNEGSSSTRKHEFTYEFYTRSIYSPVNEALKRGTLSFWHHIQKSDLTFFLCFALVPRLSPRSGNVLDTFAQRHHATSER
jgi:hypothetical protein